MPKDTQTVKDDTLAAAPASVDAAAATPPEDPTVLKDSSPESLSSVFKALVTQDREQRAQFRPTLAKLNEIVTRFHAIGNDQVGIELANFDKLRDFNLVSRPGGDQAPFYAILSVYEARFLIRVYPEQKIDCYTENLAKPMPNVQSLDSDEFWYKTERSSGGSLKVMKNEPKFLRYSLESPDDTVAFMTAIIQTAASCAANNELKEYDIVPARETLMPKNQGLKIRKP